MHSVWVRRVRSRPAHLRFFPKSPERFPLKVYEGSKTDRRVAACRGNYQAASANGESAASRKGKGWRSSGQAIETSLQFVLKTAKALGLASRLQRAAGWPHLPLAQYRACAVAVDVCGALRELEREAIIFEASDRSEATRSVSTPFD
jgi:hypothetical protein